MLRGGQGPAPIAADPQIEAAVRGRLAAIARENPASLDDGSLYDRIIAEVERPLIAAMLERHGGNQLRAARALGINRNTLRKRLTDLGLAGDMRPGAAIE
ncbi:helix-turn-helix domain-containing protein, partial [Sphingomonas sp.]|uniref:helix-turn-helix domain-containing protein n=1 Tax=Sphingomonas sp. TaxID=28214 RepID=UPI002CEA8488